MAHRALTTASSLEQSVDAFRFSSSPISDMRRSGIFPQSFRTSPVVALQARLYTLWPFALLNGGVWPSVGNLSVGSSREQIFDFNRVSSISYPTFASGVGTRRPNHGNFDRCVFSAMHQLNRCRP